MQNGIIFQEPELSFCFFPWYGSRLVSNAPPYSASLPVKIWTSCHASGGRFWGRARRNPRLPTYDISTSEKSSRKRKPIVTKDVENVQYCCVNVQVDGLTVCVLFRGFGSLSCSPFYDPWKVQHEERSQSTRERTRVSSWDPVSCPEHCSERCSDRPCPPAFIGFINQENGQRSASFIPLWRCRYFVVELNWAMVTHS